MKNLGTFTRLYPLSKTLRFRLKPIGMTLDNIIKTHILEEDKLLAESYTKVKKIIDEYHKAFIEKSLSVFQDQTKSDTVDPSLEEYYRYYHIQSKEEHEKEAFKAIQANLRKQIADKLSKDAIFKRIDKKELIHEDLLNFVENDPDCQTKRSLIQMFKDFTTYFSGFHENRKSLYSSGEQSSAIAYRLIHENLPKFIDNMKVFETLCATEMKSCLPDLFTDFSKYLSVGSIEEMFRLSYFYTVLTQEQIDLYNAVIEGYTDEHKTHLLGINEYIDRYNQEKREEKLPLLQVLYKQILSDKAGFSWLPSQFNSDNQVLRALNKSFINLKEYILLRHSLRDLLSSIRDYDLSGVFIRNDAQLSEISFHIFGNSGIIARAIRSELSERIRPREKETQEAFQERISAYFSSYESFSIKFIDQCLKAIGIENCRVENYFKSLGAVRVNNIQQENYFDRITRSYLEIRPLLEGNYPQDKSLAQDRDSIRKIKKLLDLTIDLQHFIEPLLGKGDEPDKDERFYGEFSGFWNQLNKIGLLYKRVRDYVTRKPYSSEKVKMNFDTSTLMNGWDVNKERHNRAVILRKDGLYYLGIMKKESNKVFDSYPSSGKHGSYEKVEYKFLPGANKMLPKVFFSKAHIDEYHPSPRIREIYASGTYKKGEKFSLKDCHLLIDFFKASLMEHPEWKNFGFHFSCTDSYRDMSGFYKEVEEQAYKIMFRDISSDYVDTLVREGKLFLFQIYSKDFSSFSKGRPNMHTLYWKMIFDPRNLEDVVFKLNGQAEIFYRKASITKDTLRLPSGTPLWNKSGNASQKESLFGYDLIRHRRYTEDSFQLHVPITINYRNEGIANINSQVNEFLKEKQDLRILGLVRGEEHLLYAVVINLRGQIIEQFSLDEMLSTAQGRTYRTDYARLLKLRKEECREARHSWKSIDNTKALKEGYLSQVVHRLTDLMIRYEAPLVMEDLNTSYNPGHRDIEKVMYQNLQKKLIDKLNYLADKNRGSEESGGILRAYQLTNRFESLQKSGRQNGFLFFVPAWYTREVDSVTGFTNLLDFSYISIERSRDFFSKFDSILFSPEKDEFIFSFDYSRFTGKASGSRSRWTVRSQGYKTQQFRELMEEYQIALQNDLQGGICRQEDRNFHEKALYLLKQIFSIKNTDPETGRKYLSSPVVPEGETDDLPEEERQSVLPSCSDANAAYNIARKGLWSIWKMKSEEQRKGFRMSPSNEEWLNFIQKKLYLRK